MSELLITILTVPVIPNYLFQKEHPDDYRRLKGDLDTPGSIQICGEMQENITQRSYQPTDHETALIENIRENKFTLN